MVGILAFFVLSTPGQPQAQEESNLLNRFVESFNSGTLAGIKKFVADTHDSSVITEPMYDQISARLAWTRESYGSVAVKKVVREESRITLWVRSEHNRAWLGFVLFKSKAQPGKLLAIGIDRGQTPPPDFAEKSVATDQAFEMKAKEYIRHLRRTNGFSGALSIWKNGKPMVEAAIGQAHQGLAATMTTRTAFPIASISKLFVTTSLLQLEQRGKLLLKDPVRKWIPELPETHAAATRICDLLNHSAGIELDEIPEFMKETRRSFKQWTSVIADYLDNMPKRENFRVGQDYDYSNEGYDLAARVVELASGTSYYSYVNEHVLRPSGMLSTFPLHAIPDRLPVSEGYSRRRSDGTFRLDDVQRITYQVPELASAAGGYVSTVGDLQKFWKALSGQVLLQKNLQETLKDYRLKINSSFSVLAGIQEHQTPLGLAYGHTGARVGFSGSFLGFPQKGYSIMVLSNRDDQAGAITNWLLEIMPRRPLPANRP